jgi:endonuclease YncB( thermonuclease family)
MGVCLSRAGEAVDDYLDGQSRYYREAKNAKDYLKKKQCQSQSIGGDSSHVSAVLNSGISPIYPSLPKASEKHHCRNVYDGDTLTLDNGDRVRLLGIDTPELKEKQPFAVDSKEYTKKYCYGKDIWLSFDGDENKDHYGRLLAFVWVSLGESKWLCINEGLVASGLAHAYSPTKTKKVHNYDKMLSLQKLARTHKRGQWKSYKDEKVITTPNGSAFHKSTGKGSTTSSDCKHLAKSKNLSIIPASQAYDRGLHPCRNCFG